MSRIACDAAIFVGLAIVSLAVGWWLDQGRVAPLPLVYQSRSIRLDAEVAHAKAKNPVQRIETASEPREITLDEFQNFVTSRRGLILDARPAVFFRSAHVPSALNVSRENFEADYARELPRLSVRKESPIAVYCSDADCSDSTLVAVALVNLGYSTILVYREGWAEWTQAGLPQESSP